MDKLLGPNLARGTGNYTTADGFKVAHDDSIHVLAPGERETTLCGQSLDDVAAACSMDSGYKPDDGSGCWTCLAASNRWAELEATR
jgi:hypothetical protein